MGTKHNNIPSSLKLNSSLKFLTWFVGVGGGVSASPEPMALRNRIIWRQRSHFPCSSAVLKSRVACCLLTAGTSMFCQRTKNVEEIKRETINWNIYSKEYWGFLFSPPPGGWSDRRLLCPGPEPWDIPQKGLWGFPQQQIGSSTRHIQSFWHSEQWSAETGGTRWWIWPQWAAEGPGWAPSMWLLPRVRRAPSAPWHEGSRGGRHMTEPASKPGKRRRGKEFAQGMQNSETSMKGIKTSVVPLFTCSPRFRTSSCLRMWWR